MVAVWGVTLDMLAFTHLSFCYFSMFSNPLFRENLQFFPMRVDANNPHKLADFCASIGMCAESP